jgi:hypothetical protein
MIDDEDRAAPSSDDFPIADAVAAHALVRPWWRALAEDDDGAVRRLNHPRALDDASIGLASRLRDGLGVSVEQCAAMGVFNTVSVLGDGGWAFRCKTGVRSYERPSLSRKATVGESTGGAARGWLIRVDKAEDGSWRVWGSVSDQETIIKVILPPVALQAVAVTR